VDDIFVLGGATLRVADVAWHNEDKVEGTLTVEVA
jgi:hypothetical protein